MTILFFARRFYPAIGGVEKHVMEVSKKLLEKNHKVIVITENNTTYQLDSQSAKNTEIINGIHIYRITAGSDNKYKKFKIWLQLWNLRKVLQSADIIHCHDVFFWYLPFRFIYPNKPVFTTFHGYESYPVSKKAIVVRKISEKLSRGNICIGNFIKKWYKTKPTYVSYGAVNIRIKNHESRIKEKRESALFFGRLDEQTGILEYVHAVTNVKKYYPDFDLLIIGDGKYKKLIDKEIKVIGFQKNPEKYFADYHFAFVSRYLSILEAFAAKRLVFAVYDNPIKEDYLKMTPFAKWIIAAGDEKELTEKIKYYLKHPDEEKKMIDNAYHWVEKQSWKEMTNLYVRLWKGDN